MGRMGQTGWTWTILTLIWILIWFDTLMKQIDFDQFQPDPFWLTISNLPAPFILSHEVN